MFRVPEHRFCFWEELDRLDRHGSRVTVDGNIQAVCRTAVNLRPPRMFRILFRL
jgi:hypothetical protein